MRPQNKKHCSHTGLQASVVSVVHSTTAPTGTLLPLPSQVRELLGTVLVDRVATFEVVALSGVTAHRLWRVVLTLVVESHRLTNTNTSCRSAGDQQRRISATE